VAERGLAYNFAGRLRQIVGRTGQETLEGRMDPPLVQGQLGEAHVGSVRRGAGPACLTSVVASGIFLNHGDTKEGQAHNKNMVQTRPPQKSDHSNNTVLCVRILRESNRHTRLSRGQKRQETPLDNKCSTRMRRSRCSLRERTTAFLHPAWKPQSLPQFRHRRYENLMASNFRKRYDGIGDRSTRCASRLPRRTVPSDPRRYEGRASVPTWHRYPGGSCRLPSEKQQSENSPVGHQRSRVGRRSDRNSYLPQRPERVHENGASESWTRYRQEMAPEMLDEEPRERGGERGNGRAGVRVNTRGRDRRDRRPTDRGCIRRPTDFHRLQIGTSSPTQAG